MKKQANQREITCIFGKTGTGKSWFLNEYLYKYNRVVILDPLNEYDGHECENIDEIIDYMDRPLFRVKFSDVSQFDLLCEIVYASKNICFCIEEAQRVIPAGNERMSNNFLDIIYRGRHNNISVIIASQRPSTVNISIRSQYTSIVCFNVTEPDDLQYLYKTTGYNEVFELPQLTHRNYLLITPEGVMKKYSE